MSSSSVQKVDFRITQGHGSPAENLVPKAGLPYFQSDTSKASVIVTICQATQSYCQSDMYTWSIVSY